MIFLRCFLKRFQTSSSFVKHISSRFLLTLKIITNLVLQIYLQLVMFFVFIFPISPFLLSTFLLQISSSCSIFKFLKSHSHRYWSHFDLMIIFYKRTTPGFYLQFFASWNEPNETTSHFVEGYCSYFRTNFLFFGEMKPPFLNTIF